MSKAKLEDFFPYYPDPYEQKDNYNALLYAKHEYRQLGQDRPQVNSIYRNHQRINQIHLGVGTPNKYLIMFESPGLGKTCSAIGMAETRHEWVTKYYPSTDDSEVLSLVKKPALIIAQNVLAVTGTFNKDIVETCTDFNYMSKEKMLRKKSETSTVYEAAKTKAVNKGYEITTHKKMMKKIGNNSSLVSQNYSGRVIIIDEVHEYRTELIVDTNGNYRSKPNGKQIYNPMMDFLDNIYGCVIIIMTATPLVDRVTELPSILNIGLPKNERINPDDFRAAINEDDLDATRVALEEILVPKLLGKVSRMQIPQEDMKTIVRTNESLVNYPKPRLSKEALWLSVLWTKNHINNPHKLDFKYLSDINYGYTTNLIIQDSMSSKSLQSDNIVWPDGQSIGTEGVAEFLVPSNGFFEFSESFIGNFNYHLDAVRNAYIDDLIKENNPQMAEHFRSRLKVYVGQMDYKNPNTGTLDIIVTLRVIKTRFSAVTGDLIEQILGIETHNVETNQYEYLLNSDIMSLPKGNEECAYVFNENHASGVVKDGLFFKMFGFERLHLKDSATNNRGIVGLTKKFRYGIIHGSTGAVAGADKEASTASMNRNLIELFNHPDNKNGEYLKILFGTQVSAQGINLKNVRQAHPTSRGWNDATNEQAEARADRPGNSHLAFNDSDPISIYNENIGGEINPIEYGVAIVNGKKTRKYLKMFRHALYNQRKESLKGPDTDLKDLSVGIKKYDRAEEKYRISGIAVDIVQKCAYNLYLNNIGKNAITSPPSYGFPSNGMDYPTDYSTFNLFYSGPEIEAIKAKVRVYFKTFFRTSIVEILEYLNKYHASTVTKALTSMVNDNERFLDRHGMLNYLREDGDILFLQRISRGNTFALSDPLLNYYSEHLYVHVDVEIESLFENIELAKLKSTIDTIAKMDPNSPKIISEYISNMSPKLQSFILEDIVSNYPIYIQSHRISAELMNIVINAMKLYVIYMNYDNTIPVKHRIVHWFQVRAKKMGKTQGKYTIAANAINQLRVYDTDTFKWRNSKRSDDTRLIPIMNQHITQVLADDIPEFDFYGTSMLSQKIKTFSIQETAHYQKNSQRKTQTNNIASNSTGPDGEICYPLPKNFIITHIHSVDISIYALFTVYPQIKDSQIPFENQFYRFTLEKLRRIDKTEYDALTEHDKRLSVQYQNEIYVVFTESVGEITFNHEISCNVPFSRNHRWPFVKAVRREVIHYNKINPEMFLWAFQEELHNQRYSSDRISPHSDIPFYPSVKLSANPSPVTPQSMEYADGYDYYSNMLEAFPADGNRISLFESTIGTPNPTSSNTCVAFLSKGRILTLNDNGTIMSSLFGLHRDLQDLNPGTPYVKTNTVITNTKGSQLPVYFDSRFFRYTSAYTKQNLTMLLYLIFHLSGRLRYRDLS
jgi:hypothetical protein